MDKDGAGAGVTSTARGSADSYNTCLEQTDESRDSTAASKAGESYKSTPEASACFPPGRDGDRDGPLTSDRYGDRYDHHHRNRGDSSSFDRRSRSRSNSEERRERERAKEIVPGTNMTREQHEALMNLGTDK